MQAIKSNEIMSSFGMKGITLDEMMEIDGGCGLRFGCGENCTCKGGGSYQPSCGDKGNNNGNDNTISIPWPCFGKKN